MAVRRDKYGRFRGKGGIKPFKSNLQGKKMSGRKRAVIGVVATATVIGGAYAYNKRSQAVSPKIKRAPKGGKAVTNGSKPGGNPFLGTIAKSKAKPVTRQNKNFQPGRSAFKNTSSQQSQQFQRAEQIVQGRKISRSNTLTNVMANQAKRAVDRI